jgi:hypothetical protein
MTAKKKKAKALFERFLVDCIQVIIALTFAAALSHYIDLLPIAVAFGLWVVAQLIAAAYFILTAKD